jgi:hypothetical protein
MPGDPATERSEKDKSSEVMKMEKPKSRTGASKPKETRHLSEAEKQSLEEQGEAEHADGKARERLMRRLSKRR